MNRIDLTETQLVLAAAREFPGRFGTRELVAALEMSQPQLRPRAIASHVSYLHAHGQLRKVGRRNARENFYVCAPVRALPSARLSPLETAWREFRASFTVQLPELESTFARGQ